MFEIGRQAECQRERNRTAQSAPENHGLFRALDAGRKPVDLTAIPYYAWANREKGPMTIWINETPGSGNDSNTDNK